MQNENIKNNENGASEAKNAPKKNYKTAQKKTFDSNKKPLDKSTPNAQKRRYYKPKYPKAKTTKETNAKSSMVAPKKIKLLFTIVNREKTEFFVDFLHEFEINMQLVLSAQGTAKDDIISLLGLTDSDKSVIISVIRQDKIKDALAALGEKFNTVKGGKGIAYTVPIKSAIGVAIYRFLSNTSGGGLING